MCGIAGLIHRGKSSKVGHELQGMLQALKHRGEDSTGYALYGDTDGKNFIMRVKGQLLPLLHWQAVQESAWPSELKTSPKTSFPASCCSLTAPLRKATGSARTAWKERLNISAGITHVYGHLSVDRCISPTQFSPQTASSILGKCITAGSWQILAYAMKTSLQ